MAHSYVQAFSSEIEAFRSFTSHFPETTLVVDTYDSLAGVGRVVDLSRELGNEFRVKAIRLDSGDLAGLAKAARKILDDAGLAGVSIFASGGLDEEAVEKILATGAPIDAFGVGTRMGVSEDAPSLEIAYKLAEFAGTGRVKLAPGKAILPGRKQVFRAQSNGVAVGDTIARSEENLPGTRLLTQVMKGGQRTARPISLKAIRDYAKDQVAGLPISVRGIAHADPAYPVVISDVLSQYLRQVEQSVNE
jgi:nicotinate phosphoribosyltransferase